jgi:hypothetical protein
LKYTGLLLIGKYQEALLKYDFTFECPIRYDGWKERDIPQSVSIAIVLHWNIQKVTHTIKL